MPNTINDAVISVVITGRRIQVSEMFMSHPRRREMNRIFDALIAAAAADIARHRLPYLVMRGLRIVGEQRSRIHKPSLDEMGIALSHEVAPHRPKTGPRSTTGRAGMRGGWKPRGR